MNEAIIKKYLLYIVVVVLAIFAGLYYTVPKIPQYITKTDEIKAKKESIADLNKSLELIKKSAIESMDSQKGEEKQIYEPEIKSEDAMVSFNGLLETVLELAKQSGLKIKTIEFKTIPESDPVKQNHADTHNATLLDSQVIGTYTELQNFLREVYRHQYLIGINEIKVTPYMQDKKILIINMSLALYAKK